MKASAVLLNIAIIRGIYKRRRIKKILFRAAKNCAGKEKIMLDKRVLYGYNNSRDGQLAQLVWAHAWRAWGHRFESCTVHHLVEPKKISMRKTQKFQRLPGFLRPSFEVGKKDIKKGFGKINGLEPLPKAFWAAFPRIFRESGSFSASAKCRILTGVFVGSAECALQAQMPAR